LISRSAIDLIGNTPLVTLDRLHSGPGQLLAKCEFMQPGGSVKDRAALQIINDAYDDKRLVKGRPVVEMTSGNMGAGLAVVCNVTGNPFVAVMSKGNSPARVKMLESLGAEVVLTSQVDGSPGMVTGKDIEVATEEAIRISKEKDAFYVDQFNNESSLRAHELGTGPEIWEEVGNELDCFVAAVGSGGTFLGTSKYLKNRKAGLYCAAVEPEGTQVLSGKPITDPRHVIQGIGYSLVPPHWDPKLCDETVAVTDDEAIRYRSLLAEKESLLVGYSAAANVCASVKLMNSGKFGKYPMVVTILCDTGLKY